MRRNPALSRAVNRAIANGAPAYTEITPAQAAYEAELRARPTYDDGTPRKPWRDLPDYVKATWQRNPTPRWLTTLKED